MRTFTGLKTQTRPSAPSMLDPICGLLNQIFADETLEQANYENFVYAKIFEKTEKEKEENIWKRKKIGEEIKNREGK